MMLIEPKTISKRKRLFCFPNIGPISFWLAPVSATGVMSPSVSRQCFAIRSVVMDMKESVMLDLETWGTRPGAAIAAIGAVKFTRDTVGEKFYFTPSWAGRFDPETVRWWMRQHPDAKDAISREPMGSIEEGCQKFREFLGDRPVWGNGADFDNVILLDRFHRFGVPGWDHRQNRCYRTIKNLFPGVPKPAPRIAHHALEDAISQARHLMAIYHHHGI